MAQFFHPFIAHPALSVFGVALYIALIWAIMHLVERHQLRKPVPIDNVVASKFYLLALRIDIESSSGFRKWWRTRKWRRLYRAVRGPFEQLRYEGRGEEMHAAHRKVVNLFYSKCNMVPPEKALTLTIPKGEIVSEYWPPRGPRDIENRRRANDLVASCEDDAAHSGNVLDSRSFKDQKMCEDLLTAAKNVRDLCYKKQPSRSREN